MAFLTGLVSGYADAKAEQMRTNEQRYQEMLETYRARALEAYQTYNKTKQAQQAQLRALKNFATQHFGGDLDAARSFVDLYGGNIPEAHKAILDRGAPSWAGSTEQQMANAGLSDTAAPAAQASGQATAMGDPMRTQPVQQAPQAQQTAQQQEQPASDGEAGLLDTLASFIQERASRIFNPPGMPEVRQQVAKEMGMDVEQLNALMSYNYSLDPGYTPVAMEHPRLGISDLSNIENTIIRDAYVRGGPEAAVAAARRLEANKTDRANTLAQLREEWFARLTGINPRTGGGAVGVLPDSTRPGPAGPADRPNQSRSGTIGIIEPGRTVTDTTTGQTYRFKGGDPKDESNWDLVQ